MSAKSDKIFFIKKKKKEKNPTKLSWPMMPNLVRS